MKLNTSLVLLAAVGSVGFTNHSTYGATVLDFEGSGTDGGEGLTNTGTNTSTTFGVTHGTQSLTIANTGANFTLFDIGTATAGSTGAGIAHYNAINAGLTESGTKYVSFDISIDTTNITTFNYFQFSLPSNSDNGYTNAGYGDLINLYNFSAGLELGGKAVTEGATLTPIVPFANGVGTYHFSEPLFSGPTSAPGYDGAQLTFGNGGDGTTGNYYQIRLIGSGSYVGTANFAIDNFQIGTVPEPTSAGVIGVAAVVALARKRKSR